MMSPLKHKSFLDPSIFIFRVHELTCGGLGGEVREAFAETMTSVVQLAARYPTACRNSVGLLCTVPYTRREERCLVRSGLLHLLDKLCSLSSGGGGGSAGAGAAGRGARGVSQVRIILFIIVFVTYSQCNR